MAQRAAGAIQRINVATSRALAPERRAAILADAARAALADAIASGRASDNYTRFVDGREGAPERDVRAEGVILYRFTVLPAAIAYALAFARTRSPAASGAYRDGWRVYVDGVQHAGPLAAIPAGAACMIVNPLPYARKIDVGAMKRMRAPAGVVEAIRQAVQRRYPTLQADRAFVALTGRDPRGGPLPYILRSAGKSRRRDRQAGQPLTYPAVLIRQKA